MFKNLVQGALGNYSEVSVRELIQEYGDFLLTDETISSGYKLVRDALIFTNYRMIFVDKQGATGKKTAYHTILMNAPFASVQAYIQNKSLLCSAQQ